jgi:hypothetical protein
MVLPTIMTRMVHPGTGEDGHDGREQQQEETHGDTSSIDDSCWAHRRRHHARTRADRISAERNAPLAAQQPKGVANLTLGLGGESVVAGERQQQDEPDGPPESGNGWSEADRVHDVWAS